MKNYVTTALQDQNVDEQFPTRLRRDNAQLAQIKYRTMGQRKETTEFGGQLLAAASLESRSRVGRAVNKQTRVLGPFTVQNLSSLPVDKVFYFAVVRGFRQRRVDLDLDAHQHVRVGQPQASRPVGVAHDIGFQFHRPVVLPAAAITPEILLQHAIYRVRRTYGFHNCCYSPRLRARCTLSPLRLTTLNS